ncbi:MAG: FAD-dependent oxidoreductase [Chloroflexota bacterium]|nr:FAD-dependent oxidoreductase [Chloroflexota bacterium]
MYPPEMAESLDKVAATRERRLQETHPTLPPDEKKALLEGFHPDFVDGGMSEIKVGPNKGDKAPNELADLLEGNTRVDPKIIDLETVDYECDVLVIGGGGAGASAALLAQENGANVILATKLRLGDANTVGAEGGTQAATKPQDSPTIHYLDAMGGGGFHNIPELVEALVKDAPLAIDWLEKLGVMWDKDTDGSLKTESGGGTSRKRMHSARDYTGLEEMRVLRDEVRNRDIQVLEFSPAVELVMDEEGKVAGAIFVNLETNEMTIVRAKATVLATGGGGRLHYQEFPTTNHYGATADGLVLASRVGARLIFIDTMQYHPTGVAYPEQIVGQLVTEKVRGLGAHLVNIDGDQFIYPLETRDAVASSVIRECKGRNKGVITPTGQPGVWLDSPMIDILRGKGTIARELPAMLRQFMRFDIDMSQEPVLIYPTLHYQNGGILIDANGQTTVANLFAAGEVEGGVHGRNRLMGNSTLDIFVFGRRAGKAAAERAKESKIGKPTLDHVNKWQQQIKEAGLEDRPISPMLLPDYTRHGRIASLRGSFAGGLE